MTPPIKFSPPLAALVTAGLLAACGTGPPNAAPDAATLTSQGARGAVPGQYRYVHRVKLPAGVGVTDLAATYGGYVVSHDPLQGTAIVANDSPAKGPYDAAMEANVRGYGATVQGYGTWASGFSTWASGFSTWASGTPSTRTPATTFAANVPLWRMIGLGDAHALVPELGAGVTVAVIDTGVDLNHPVFASKLDTLGARDFIDGDTTPMEVNASTTRNGVSAGYGHGTAVASVVLQVAPNATILPIRALGPDGQGDTATIAAAIDHAIARGARVINLSLGSVTYSDALDAQIRAATSRGIAVVCASGNGGDRRVLYPAATAGSTAPSAHGSLSVGSVNPSFLKSAFSTYGPTLELAAPGENIVTAFPGSQSAHVSGTSFATPVVSGLIALALSTGVNSGSGGQLSSVLSNLTSSATPPTDPVYKDGLGHGTVNAAAFVRTSR